MRDRPTKLPWSADPAVRAFTEATEIPDTFPVASVFRRAGYTTYLTIFRMPSEELAALGLDPDVDAAIRALRLADAPAADGPSETSPPAKAPLIRPLRPSPPIKR